MLPLAIQLGSIIVGRVVANQIIKLVKKDQEVSINNEYIKRFYTTNITNKISFQKFFK